MKGTGSWYRLRHAAGSKEVKGSFILFMVAAIAFSLPFLILFDFTISAVLILSGFTCFIIGLIMLVFYRGDMVLPDVAGMLTPGIQTAFGKTVADIGGEEGAYIIPGNPILQLIPLTGSAIPSANTCSHLKNWRGTKCLEISPPSLPLWHHLRTKYKLIQTEDFDAALASYAESVRYALELADRVEGRLEGDLCSIEITWYKLYEGCALVRQECPDCCTMVPCGVCGLAGIILAEGTNEAWKFDRIMLTPETRSIRIELRRVLASS
ncbi:hypothetical protein RJ53_10845 [Methanocalculus chunghsingensis]|uniref:Uncharacterized protein n=1 Tax=Methanocalculus chunghsingensis TaxID=156457 RepID=A0A8J7W7N8_9EURY|nr:hypothetical protein [Methanocalculus chunghsingensis]MBR1369946.1 hypothetical protein [Methanocalculus chunghsingensis]